MAKPIKDPPLPTDPAARLRLAAAGRREYIKGVPNHVDEEYLKHEASCYDQAADILTDDLLLRMILPTWLMWDEKGNVLRPIVTVEWKADDA